MQYIVLTVGSYLIFNLGVWFSTRGGSDFALPLGYMLGCTFIRLRLAGQIKQQANHPIQWWVVIGNTASILITANALRYAHARIPLSLSMEAVYNGLAMASWFVFLLLGRYWPRQFSDQPKWFDLGCHGVMFMLVVTRFSTYGQFHLTGDTIVALICGILGYIGVNITIKLMAGHRLSSVYGILGAAAILLGVQITSGLHHEWHWSSDSIISILLVSIASYGVPVYLAGAYGYFKGLASLVPPLVYDSLLVASPLVMIVRQESISYWTIIVAINMLIVTVVRYLYHTGGWRKLESKFRT